MNINRTIAAKVKGRRLIPICILMVNRRPLEKSFAPQHGCTMVSREVQDLSTLWVIDYGKQEMDVVVSALNDGVVEHESGRV